LFNPKTGIASMRREKQVQIPAGGSGQRRDCDLTLKNWSLYTVQTANKTIKHWHSRTARSECPKIDANSLDFCQYGPGWAILNPPGVMPILVVSCKIILGLIHSCNIDDRAISVRNWVYLPPRGDGDSGLGTLILMGDERMLNMEIVGQGRLVLRTSFEVIETSRSKGNLTVDELDHEIKVAILTLSVREAIASAKLAYSDSCSRLVEALGFARDEASLPALRAIISNSREGINVRGVLGISIWPITLVRTNPQVEILRPIQLDMSEIDDDGEFLFDLMVRPDSYSDKILPSLLMIATDNLYRLVAAE
jgi:hypothetical protein